MTERRFQYERPKNTDERIEAIYEEFRTTSSSKNPLDTLKDYVIALLAHSKHVESTKEFERESDNYSILIALHTLAFVATLFLWFGLGSDASSDWKWLNNHRFPLRLWGIAFAAVFIGVSIERSSLFRKLWSFGFTKIVASIAVSALLLFSTGKASSLINAVFGVDASAFPLTRAFIAGILAFQYSSPLLIVVAFFAILHTFDLAGYIKSKVSSDYSYDFPPMHSIAFIALAIVVLSISWRWMYHDFSEETFPKKIYRLAHELDFNSRHSCANIKEGVTVVFVGSDHSKVLVDVNIVQTENIESFVDPEISNNIAIPKRFFFLPCNPGILPE